MKTVAIIQARMGSTRLPGKVLRPIGERDVLGWCVDRICRAQSLSDVVIATTDLSRDDVLVDWCQARGRPSFRGPEDDVLTRYARAAEAFGADVVVRVTSDCPLIDPNLVDEVIHHRAMTNADYVSNNFPEHSYPIGLDVECFTREALDTACREDKRPDWREHVTPYIRNSGWFDVRGVACDEPLGGLRWTVDTPEDLALASHLIGAAKEPLDAGWRDFLSIYRAHPEWATLNAHVAQRKVQLTE